jgi:hypothetical protein
MAGLLSNEFHKTIEPGIIIKATLCNPATSSLRKQPQMKNMQHVQKLL